MEIRWKNHATKAIGVAKLTDDDEHVLSFVGYEPCYEENFTDDDYDGELVEVWKPIKKPKDEWFGTVRWCDDDIKNALEVQGITTTESNIEKLHNMCSHHSFTDMMIERGWEIMYDIIAQNDWGDLYQCNICNEIIEVEDANDCDEILWGHIQMEHEDVFEEIQDWDTPEMIEEYYM